MMTEIDTHIQTTDTDTIFCYHITFNAYTTVEFTEQLEQLFSRCKWYEQIIAITFLQSNWNSMVLLKRWREK